MVASAPPQWLRVETAGLPAELTKGSRYVVWKAEPRKGKPGKWEKAPRRSDTLGLASTTDPSTWSSFSDAFTAYEQHPDLTGIGRIMSDDDGITGVDLDDSIAEDGSVKPWAQEIVDALPGAYWELSPSGKGLRGFCLGKLPPGRRKRTYQGASIEIYDDVRHLTLTGHAVLYVETLPQLQEAVEAVHARWFAGGDAADGAIVTTRIGQADTVTPEGLKVLELVMGGKYAAQMADIWAGKTDSDQDWALACETARHAIALGHSGDDLGQVVEDVMRAGPWRAKWDRPYTVTENGQTVRTTWLGRTIGRAINTVRKRLERSPDFRVDELEDEHEAAPAEETPAQTIARLQRELAQARTVVATQQTIIRNERERRQALQEFVSAVGDVLARPNEEMGAAAKVLTLVTTLEMHTRVSKGQYNIARGRLADLSGFSPSTVTTVLKQIATAPDKRGDLYPDGKPFRRIVTRKRTTDPETGLEMIVSTLEVTPWHATPRETLQAAATFTPAEDRPKHGGRRVAAQRWEPCEEHAEGDVVLQGRCVDDNVLVADWQVTAEEFRALKAHLAPSETNTPPVVVLVPKGKQVALSDRPTRCLANRPDGRQCGAMEFRQLPGGSWRCLRSGHDPSAYELPAVMGASE